MSCLGLGVAGCSLQTKRALLCSVDIRGEICVIKEEKLHYWHYMCLVLHYETLKLNPIHHVPLSHHPCVPFLLWGCWSCGPGTPEPSVQWPAASHPLPGRCAAGQQGVGAPWACHSTRVMGLNDSLLTPGDKCVGVTDVHQVRGSAASFCFSAHL